MMMISQSLTSNKAAYIRVNDVHPRRVRLRRYAPRAVEQLGLMVTEGGTHRSATQRKEPAGQVVVEPLRLLVLTDGDRGQAEVQLTHQQREKLTVRDAERSVRFAQTEEVTVYWSMKKSSLSDLDQSNLNNRTGREH